MEFLTGLVSVTFRKLTPDEIITLSSACKLVAIEWGGDVHVPAGNAEIASAIGKMSREARFEIAEYGSYYRIGKSAPAEIAKVVSSADLLGTKTVRVWAFDKNFANTTKIEYENAVADAKRICENYSGLLFCLECHQNTLTEDYRDALKFLSDVDCPNLKMFWQPNQYRSHAYNLEACRTLLPYIRAVHVFSWESENGKTERLPLAAHADRWAEYLKILQNAPVDKLPLMLEFVHDDRPETLKKDAEILRGWVKQ